MYHRVGTYDGRVPLQEMAKRLESFDVAWAPSEYGTTVEHLTLIRDAFRPDLAEAIPGVWAYSMLVAIRPGGNIQVHKDLQQREGTVRHHLVLQTNDRCWNFHDSDWQQLELGGIYIVDETKEHGSLNWGDSLRIHLVVDVLVPARVPTENVIAA